LESSDGLTTKGQHGHPGFAGIDIVASRILILDYYPPILDDQQIAKPTVAVYQYPVFFFNVNGFL
jgi:hypothetical protein